MASVPPPDLSSPSPSSENLSSSLSCPAKEVKVKKYPTTAANHPVLLPSSNTTNFSVETRICPAKHGIAVSICLVDSTVVSSSLPLQAKETKSLGSVFPKMWEEPTPTNANTAPNLSPVKHSSVLNTNRSELVDQVVAEGEYIDLLQAIMLFGPAHSLAEPQKSQIQHPQSEAQMQIHPQRPGQINAHAQLQLHQQAEKQPGSNILLPAQAHNLMQLPPSPKSQRCLRSAVVSSPSKFAQPGSPTSPHYSHPQQPPFDTCEPLLRNQTVHFSEKPCCSRTKRRQGGKFGRAQEMRCRYRESYQAAIQHPVSVSPEKDNAMAAALEENGDCGFSHCYNRSMFENMKRELHCDVLDTKLDPEMQKDLASVNGSIFQESREEEKIPYWKQRESIRPSYIEYKQDTALSPSNLVKQSTMDLNEHQYVLSAKSFDHLNNMNGANPDLKKDSGKHITTNPEEKLENEPLSVCSNFSKSSMTTKNLHWWTSETAVPNTSDKCEMITDDEQQVRRRESAGSEVPQLHVVKCKNSTAFKLVSPKTSRKKMAIPDAAQPGSVLITRSEDQNKSQLQTDEHQQEKEQDVSKATSAQQRPDHLALGPTEPRPHPLFLGLASLTGCRDRMGRAIVELYGHHQGWRSAVTSQELFQMLLYFHYITRKEIRDAGLTLIFDAKKRNPQPELYKAIMLLHESNPQAVNSLVLMVDKESNNRPQKCPGIQTFIVTSLKTLFKLVEAKQLSSHLEGGLSHSYCDWLELHQKLFPFVCDLHEVSNLLLRAISKLEEHQRRDTVQNVQQCIMDKRTLMRDILEDQQLVRLQRESGTILADLRKKSDLNYPHCKDLSDAVVSVTSLYNHVEELALVLVQRSNVLLEHLKYLLQLKEMEEHFIQIQLWFNTEGEHHLLQVESMEPSGDQMEKILNSFTGFLIEANDRRHHALSLVSEAQQLLHSGLSYPETGMFGALVCTFKSCMEDFLYRAEACGKELQIMVNVYDFCEQATALAKEYNDYLDQSIIHSSKDRKQDSISNTDPKASHHLLENYGSGLSTSADRFILQSFQDKFLHFSPQRFQEVKIQARALKGSWGMQLWNVAWLKCQKACQQLEERIQEVDLVNPPPSDRNCWQDGHYVDVMSTNVQTVSPGGHTLVVQSTPRPQHPLGDDIVSGAVDLGKRRPILGTNTPSSTNVACCNIIIKPEDGSDPKTTQGSNVTPPSPERPTRKSERESRRRQPNRARSTRDAAARSQSQTVGCQWFPWRRGLVPRSVSQDSGTKGAVTAGLSIPLEQQGRPSSSCSHLGQPSCQIIQEAQKFQIYRHGSFSTQKAAGYKHSSLPFRKYEETLCSQSPHQSTNNAVRLQRIVEELVFTEREYVRSLGYILTHYFPLMDRRDIPQELRGKQGIIFGNLEKLYNFHSQHFLPELETCQREPAIVARCFLRHGESFGLYALYSKNKPRSDGLILHCRHDIFKRKQQELGDMMDLSSYLLRPIQRISKYSLLLQDMLALSGSHMATEFTSSGCGSSPYVSVLTGSERERERAEIQAAADLVRFQMRHGNDLLTMDAIQDCDVNLKEQGQLVRQDEFTVSFRKKKCIRRVFLFEDLIIFSKTKRTDVGNDVYMYKQSFKVYMNALKTSDIGMTHNSSLSGLCFEIWFRRRKSEYTYTLKASSIELKRVWTNDLERILWNQASHSREIRIQERVFMGIGHKPFIDLQHNEAAICDRAVNCVLPARILVACCSHRGLDYARTHSIGTRRTTSTTVSQSSSSSGRGSLPSAGFRSNQSQGMDVNPGVCSYTEAVTDKENNSLFYQHQSYKQWKNLHPLLDSTESSVAGTNVFNSSERSCLSDISAEVADDSSSISQGSKPYTALHRTPIQRPNRSPTIGRKKLGVPSKAPLHTNALVQDDEIFLGKSTEV